MRGSEEYRDKRNHELGRWSHKTLKSIGYHENIRHQPPTRTDNTDKYRHSRVCFPAVVAMRTHASCTVETSGSVEYPQVVLPQISATFRRMSLQIQPKTVETVKTDECSSARPHFLGQMRTQTSLDTNTIKCTCVVLHEPILRWRSYRCEQAGQPR